MSRYAAGTLLRFTLKVARRGDYTRGDSVDFDADDPRVAVYEADPAWSKPQVVRGHHGPAAPAVVVGSPHAEKLRADLEGVLERQALAVENAPPEVRAAYAREVYERGSFLIGLIGAALGDRYLPELRRGVAELGEDLFEDKPERQPAPARVPESGTDPDDLGQGEPPAPPAPADVPPAPPAQSDPSDLGQDDSAAPPVERKPLPTEGPVATLWAMLGGGAVPAKGATLSALEEAGFPVLLAYRRLDVAKLAETARGLVAALYLVPESGTDPAT